jgi:hypothetical protein
MLQCRHANVSFLLNKRHKAIDVRWTLTEQHSCLIRLGRCRFACVTAEPVIKCAVIGSITKKNESETVATAAITPHANAAHGSLKQSSKSTPSLLPSTVLTCACSYACALFPQVVMKPRFPT